ncbi:MAG: hypothetical protein P4L10_17025 [Acidobacteriaceae bacterium]|nr:hypothetical protein [Acidobacteriaceae bacterium]
MKELITLRNGELKFFDSDALRLVGRIFLHQHFSCSATAERRLELTAQFPSPGKATYKFESDKELHSWLDAIQQRSGISYNFL